MKATHKDDEVTYKHSEMIAQRGKPLIFSVTLFWALVGAVSLFAGLSSISNSAEPIQRVTLLSIGLAGLLIAGLLFLRKAWARPAAVIYNLWLGGLLLLLVLRPEQNFIGLIKSLPTWLDQATWFTFLRFGFFVTAIVSLSLSWLLEQDSAWNIFAKIGRRKKQTNICPTCGSSMSPNADGELECGYCTSSLRQIYFLQPVLKNARRILLEFEPGHERIRIGRTVGNGEAWIDTSENKRYLTISRHHADIELNLKSGQLTLHKAFTSQEVMVDNQPVLMSSPVKLGSMIQLGKVQFILGNDQYEPSLAYFVDQMDENKRYLLRFNGLNNEQTVGRARDNDVVLNGKSDISHRHATIIFDPGSNMFFIRNESERSPVYIDGHLLEPGRTTDLSNDELIIVQLGAHNFNFLPVLYQPKSQESSYA